MRSTSCRRALVDRPSVSEAGPECSRRALVIDVQLPSGARAHH